jgi:hypothetical protein
MTRKQSFLNALAILSLSFRFTDDDTTTARLLAETSRSMIPIIAPGNDNCVKAVMIQIGDTVEGTTFGATLDTLPSCLGYPHVTAGVWYTFLGDGSPILVSTCRTTHNDSSTADAFLSLYQGSPCGQLQCLPSYLDSLSGSGYIYGGTSVGIQSTSNTTYYVHVSNRYRESSSPFFLSVSAHTRPIHGRCSKAGEIIVDGDLVRGTIHRSKEKANIATPCGSRLFNGNNGYGMAWYRINVTKNATLRASTCLGQVSEGIDRLTVVRGECDGRTCLAESSVYCDDREEKTDDGEEKDSGPFFDFDVIADGTIYSIIVWGQFVNSRQQAFFELDIHTFNPPDNNDCETAIGLIVDGPSVIGTLFDSTPSFDAFDYPCGYGAGVWYSFIGTGDLVSASSCSDVYSHSISIYEGVCGVSLKCFAPPRVVIPKGCYSNGGSSAPVQSVKGVTYHVYVWSVTGTLIDGSFTLSVTTVTSPPNDEWSGAIEVVPDENLIVVGNTMDVMSRNQTLTNNECHRCASQSPALWYLVRGTGKAMRADAPSSDTHFYTVISIFEDPTNDDSCLGWDDNRCRSWVIWQTELGVDYYILVAGYGMEMILLVSLVFASRLSKEL